MCAYKFYAKHTDSIVHNLPDHDISRVAAIQMTMIMVFGADNLPKMRPVRQEWASYSQFPLQKIEIVQNRLWQLITLFQHLFAKDYSPFRFFLCFVHVLPVNLK